MTPVLLHLVNSLGEPRLCHFHLDTKRFGGTFESRRSSRNTFFSPLEVPGAGDTQHRAQKSGTLFSQQLLDLLWGPHVIGSLDTSRICIPGSCKGAILEPELA